MIMSSCFALQYPVYQPAMRIISAITQSNPMEITTTFAHLYNSGCVVRLEIAQADGMQQADQMFGPITVTGSTTFTLPIDSTNFTPFSRPESAPPSVNTCAMVVPIGEITADLNSAVQNVLPYRAS